jgi:hypothetical protein
MAVRRKKKAARTGRVSLPKVAEFSHFKVPVEYKEIPPDQQCHGYYGADEKGQAVIVIDSRLKGKDAANTYIHEVLHAIDFNMMGGTLKHSQINVLAACLVQVLKLG